MFTTVLRDYRRFRSGQRSRPPIIYDVNLSSLPEHIVARYIALHMDDETSNWVSNAGDVAPAKVMMVEFLRHFVSLTTANGIVGRGRMFVLSTLQAVRLLLGREWNGDIMSCRSSPPFDSLLDIGAGDGGVTSKLEPLFRTVTVTEYSVPMLWRLWWRGYEVLPYQSPFTDSSGSQRYYDVISCLNVLDRADRPLDLLCSMRDSLRADGILLLAVVLPWCPFVEDGNRQRAPSQHLPMEGGECCKGATFEQSLQLLVDKVLVPCGFQLERWCKLPYLCEGNMKVEYAVLYDAVMVLRKANA
ncbi:putative DREV methyltransferase [Trypanosoma vivax]|nr:putative DREV methyltransferase [Trypanosoma vivax]